MKLVKQYVKQLHKAQTVIQHMPNQAASPSKAITYEATAVSENITENPLVPSNEVHSAPLQISRQNDLELESLVEVLTKQLQRGRVETKLAVLRWIYHLFNIMQPRVS